MIYAVEKYMDVLKTKHEQETVPGFGGTREPKYHYFETEEEARAFIRKRADAACAEAEKKLARAIARTKKCQKKFGFRLGDGTTAAMVPEGKEIP